jgi:hypothetical protein
MPVCPDGRCLVFHLLNHFHNLLAPLRRLTCCCLCLFSNRDAPLDVCRVVACFHSDYFYDVCRLLGPIFRFGLHDIQCILDGGKIWHSECLTNHSRCPRDHGPHIVRRHGLSLRAVDAVQCIAKVLGEFGSVLAEFEWQVYPLGLWNSHFGAVALGDVTDVIALREPLLVLNNGQSVQTLLCCFPMVAFLWLPCATYSYLWLPCTTYYCILAETTLFIYHDLVSLAG